MKNDDTAYMVDIANFRPFFCQSTQNHIQIDFHKFHKIIQFVIMVVKTFIHSIIFSFSVVVRSFCRSSNAISKLESPHHNVVILVLFMWQWCSSKWYYMYYGSSSSNNTFNTQYYYIICSSICWAVIGILRSGQKRIRTLQSPSGRKLGI